MVERVAIENMTEPHTPIPRVGMLAIVRNRRGIIVSVDHYDSTPEGRLHLVHIEYTDSDGVPEETLLWERERNASLLEPTALPRVGEEPLMPPEDFDALVRACRWSAVTPFLSPDGAAPATDQAIAAPLYGGIQTEDFQIVPLLKALSKPRVSLLLADDVGLGKTIEAGLILTELLIRRRIRRVLILCPASLRYQWQEEMLQKFSLTFDIVDRAETHALQKRLGLDANPWRTFPRIIASYYYLRQPDILEQFRAACRQPEGTSLLPWDLLIVDEAHNLMPSNFGQDSELSRMLRLISPWFEHKLFLTATPHNGHTRCFSGLLEQLDPVRFTQTHELKPAERARIEEVVIRRLKQEINDFDAGRNLPERFAKRFLQPVPLFFDSSEKKLSIAFQAFRQGVKEAIRSSRRSEQHAGTFAVEVLNKRLLSCPYSFADSWFRFQEGLKEVESAAAAEMTAAHRESEEDIADDREKVSRGRHASRIAGAWIKPLAGRLSDEIETIDKALEALELQPDGDGLTTPNDDARWDRLSTLIKQHLRQGTDWINEERLIVFTEYKTTLDYLEKRLKAEFKDDGQAVRVLFGGDECDRQAITDSFNDPDDPVRVLVATDTASEGMNLQETARLLLHFDVPWNPSRLEQRNGRLDRHGQGRDVTVFHFASDDDADLKFLAHVVGKVDTIREDLGSMGDVFDAAFQRRFDDLQDTKDVTEFLDLAIEQTRGRADIPHKTIEDMGADEAARVAELCRHLDLTPDTLRDTLDVALGLGFGRPRLEGPDSRGKFRLRHPLPPQWSDLIDDTLRLKRKKGDVGTLPAVVFDPQHFITMMSGRPVFRPAKDTVLLHLGHPLFRRALNLFAGERFPGGARRSACGRWTVRLGGVPADADALVLLSVEELAVNELREPFHHWVRTLRLPVRGGALKEPLPYVPPVQETFDAGDVDKGLVGRAIDLWMEVAPDVPDVLDQHTGKITCLVEEHLKELGRTALDTEKERFKHRLSEVERAMRETTLKKLEREREKIMEDLRLMLPIPEIIREKEEKLRNLEDELARRRNHYQVLLDQLRKERSRVLENVLPKRYAMRGLMQVFPLSVEIRLPEVER